MELQFDDAVVGAGITGLAHAYHLAMRGRRVIIFERSPLPAGAVGASIRNFGMIWPVGQPAGEMYELARRSRELWLNVLQASGLWSEITGSLHLAYHDDEAAVLREFTIAAPKNGFDCQWLDPPQVLSKSPAVKPAELRGAMWSPIEVCVDPREVIAQLPAWLSREYKVRFAFGRAVTAYDNGRLMTGTEQFVADNLYVCAGDDLQTLFPTVFHDSGLIRCKLQMMRTHPVGNGWRIGPMLAAGLTLAHYKAFQGCPSLPTLKKRLADEMPDYVRYGIHVLVSQNGLGELTLGDSHEYGAEITPFDKQEIDELVLRYLNTFFAAPELQITSRWNGVYVKHPTDPYFIARPASGITVVTGVGGAGMTLSFGLAEKVVKENLGENKDEDRSAH
ncbi:MAG: TIGR03364 family FAD-dependent oxidoreductase [Acidobacteria bacterium]|nr:TIGR03364 family FAD-dependent oxidoreductase [Acidobacteriota bacterium]